MKRYETYKDSNILWLDKIPSHWREEKLKHISTCNDEVLPEDTPESELIHYVEISDVDSVSGIKNHTDYTFGDAPSRARRITRKNDVIISTVRTYLKAIATVKEDGLIVSTGFAVIRPTKVDQKFLAYSLLNDDFLGEVISKSVGVSYPAINSSDLIEIKLPMPPKEEQEAIASYLDIKVGQIDSAIAEKVQMLEDLKAYRSAIINEAVTKGLDKNVEMKDSGIEWLGKIPKHWNIRKIKFLSNMLSGTNLTSEQILAEGPYPVYGGNGIRGYYNDFNTEGTRVLVGRQGALCGNINLTSGKFWATEHAVVCHPIQNYDSDWFSALLEIMNLNQYSQSSAQPGLSVEKIKNLSIPIPSITEQTKIGVFVKRQKKLIASALCEIETQIAELKSYKSALITDAVTGKIDLREWKPKENNI